MVKYKQYINEMTAANQELFDKFKKIHDKFAEDRIKYQDKFNEVGKEVSEVVQEWENRLCSKMEGSGKGNYSAGLAEKFRAELRKSYPKIDLIGVKLSFAK